MYATLQAATPQKRPTAKIMRALVFRGTNQIGVEHVSIPKPGPGEAVIRVTLTTICGTDLHILRGEYRVKPGLIIGHEPVGVIHEIGVGLSGYAVGHRVLVGAITPCGQCSYCLGGNWSQCGGPIGGWKFGNTIDGAQAEYLLVPSAQANLAKIPDELSDGRKTVQWNGVAPEMLPELFETHLPVCWSCHIAETFRREYPEKVVDRPGDRGAMGEFLFDHEKHEASASSAKWN